MIEDNKEILMDKEVDFEVEEEEEVGSGIMIEEKDINQIITLEIIIIEEITIKIIFKETLKKIKIIM
jgi:hypothetical protein